MLSTNIDHRLVVCLVMQKQNGPYGHKKTTLKLTFHESVKWWLAPTEVDWTTPLSVLMDGRGKGLIECEEKRAKENVK